MFPPGRVSNPRPSRSSHDALIPNEHDRQHEGHNRHDGTHHVDRHERPFRILHAVPDVHTKHARHDAVHRHEQRRRGQHQLQFNELVTLRIQLDVDEILL